MKLIVDLIDQSTAISFRANCPYCGSSNSLSVNKVDGEYKYCCFDANCSVRGNYRTGYSVAELKQKLHKPSVNKAYSLPDYFIKGIANDLCYSYLCNHYCLQAVLTGRSQIAYDPKEHRIVFLVSDAGMLKGAVGRALGNAKPKSRIYQGSSTYPFICKSGKTLVIVEDCASACAVTRLPEYSGLALLGTNLKPEYLPVIRQYDKVLIALDNDAKHKALAMNKLIKFYTNSRVVLIPKDIKNMTDEELCQHLKENDGVSAS